MKAIKKNLLFSAWLHSVSHSVERYRKPLAFFILLAAFVVLSSAAHAQHFDWVKSYFGPDYGNGDAANDLYGSVMDSEGNIYILGHFLGGARWDNDTEILTFSAHRNRCAVIAKFSPDGEMVWHKELYSSYNDINAYTIRMVGDTSLMLCAMITFPFDHGYGERNELYYFDTLLTTSERFPEPPDTLQTPERGYGFITLELESGNIIEEHFLTLTYVKNDGSMLRSKYSDYLITYEIRGSFNVDSEGNIILARQANDLFSELCDTCPDGLYRWSPNEGNISTMRLMVDGATKQLDVPLEPSSRWNWQIIKLSPHLDSVLASTYVFDRSMEFEPIDPNEFISLYMESIDIDIYNNMYISFYRHQYRYLHLPVKNSDSIQMEWEDCVLRYSPDLVPTGIVQTPTTYIPSGHPAGDIVWLSTILDTATNSLFLMGYAARDTVYATFVYDGDTLNIKNNACWLRLNADDLSLISYGKARSTGTHSYERTYLYTDKYLWAHNGSFVAGNNRVFCQVKYQCNILFQNTQINNLYGMGLFVWDYDGHELEYIDYNSSSSNNEQGYIFLKDSSLWLTGTLTADADFGSLHVNAAYNSRAYIAHYTDTAFMTPYVYDTTNHGGGGEVRITVVGDEGAFVAYPNPFRQRVTIEVQGGETLAATAWLTDLTGRREQVRLTPSGERKTESGERVYTLDLSGRPQATYLLTLTTASGKTHTVRLMKMSDIFTR